MIATVEKRRFRFSLWSLMVAIAICALVLALGMMRVRLREALLREALFRAMQEEQRAEAERARYLAQVQLAEAALRETTAARAVRTASASPTSETPGQLWAALSVNHPVFRQGETQALNIEFTLVNDGDVVLDPKIGDSRVLINGKELADSGFLLGNGPRDARFDALPPGAHLQFGYALGDHFREPGIYRVSWRGANFQSPEVVFRVLPDSGDSKPPEPER